MSAVYLLVHWLVNNLDEQNRCLQTNLNIFITGAWSLSANIWYVYVFVTITEVCWLQHMIWSNCMSGPTAYIQIPIPNRLIVLSESLLTDILVAMYSVIRGYQSFILTNRSMS